MTTEANAIRINIEELERDLVRETQQAMDFLARAQSMDAIVSTYRRSERSHTPAELETFMRAESSARSARLVAAQSACAAVSIESEIAKARDRLYISYLNGGCRRPAKPQPGAPA